MRDKCHCLPTLALQIESTFVLLLFGIPGRDDLQTVSTPIGKQPHTNKSNGLVQLGKERRPALSPSECLSVRGESSFRGS